MVFHNQTDPQVIEKRNRSFRLKQVTVAFVLLCGLILAASVPVLVAHSSPVFTPAAKRPSLAIDGASLAGCGHTTNSCSTTLTTIHSNDTIIVYAFESLDLQTSCTFTVQDTAGLTWHFRGGISGRNDGTTGSNRDQNAEFWAQAPAPLSSDIVTESILGCASFQYGGEYNGLYAIGISGANFNNPFDPAISQALGAAGYSNTPSVNLSTSNSKDMIIAAAQQSSFGNLSPGPGFTVILATGPGGAASEYQLTSKRVTNLPVTFNDDTTWYWEELADALVSSGHHS